MAVNIPQFTVTLLAQGEATPFQLRVPGYSFDAGAVVFVLGENGSGKSTFLRAMGGEIATDDGVLIIRAFGTDLTAGPPLTGMVRQRVDENLANDLTVRENLLLRLQPTGVADYLWPNRSMELRIQAALATDSVFADRLDVPCRNLSLGQRQRLAFLAATIGRPSILLLDEFLASTDIIVSESLLSHVQQYAQSHKAVCMIVSHDPEDAIIHASRILVMAGGHFTHDLNPSSPMWSVDHVTQLLRKRVPLTGA